MLTTLVPVLQKRYEGILEAIDALSEQEQQGSGQAGGLAAGQEEQGDEERREGREEEGRGKLTEKALSTMQPGDIMPRPVSACTAGPSLWRDWVVVLLLLLLSPQLKGDDHVQVPCTSNMVGAPAIPMRGFLRCCLSAACCQHRGRALTWRYFSGAIWHPSIACRSLAPGICSCAAVLLLYIHPCAILLVLPVG